MHDNINLCFQGCQTLLPRSVWMDLASAIPQKCVRAPWTPSGTSTMICKSCNPGTDLSGAPCTAYHLHHLLTVCKVSLTKLLLYLDPQLLVQKVKVWFWFMAEEE